ncbi:MAG: hypothetical protein ACJ72D_07190 [Marmoricola sp.]
MKVNHRKARLLLLSVLAVVAALVVGTTASAQAAKAAYKVTLRTSVSTSTADRFITVSGRVTGPKATGRNVAVQRRYAGGPWVTVATAKVSRRGTYAARVETPRGGTTSFRAIKGRSSVRSAGTSATRSIPVYRWLYLSDQPGETSNAIRGVDELVDGKHYPHSIDYFDNGYMEFKLGNLCTALSTVAAYLPGPPDAPAADATLRVGTWNSGSSTFTDKVISSGTPVPINLSEVGTQFRYLNPSGTDAGYRMALLDPKVYCNADVLPTWQQSEID